MRRSLVAFGSVVVLSLAALAISGLKGVEAAGGAAPPGLNFVTEPQPKPLPPLHFTDAAGHPLSLADFHGKLVLLNIWATWCVGCREEIGALNRMAGKLDGPKFQVVAVSVDRGGAAAVDKFFSEVNVHALKVYLDPSMGVPEKLGVFGIPTSFLIDAEGREIGKVVGPAEWDQPAVLEWLRSYMPTAGAGPKKKVLHNAGRVGTVRSPRLG